VNRWPIAEHHSSAARKIAREAADSIVELLGLVAQGDAGAAAEFFVLTAAATERLTELCKAKPDLFSPIAANQISWPAMTSLHSGFLENNEALLKKLKLASNTGINISKKRTPFSLDAISTLTALEHYKLARALRRAPIGEWTIDERLLLYGICFFRRFDRASGQFDAAWLERLEHWGQHGAGKSLPPLSRDTAAKWKREFRPFLKLVHGDKCEECLELKQLRDSVVRSAKDNYYRVGGAGVVRERMLKVVIQAIDGIAPETEKAKDSKDQK
jgi:hypothetical protein